MPGKCTLDALSYKILDMDLYQSSFLFLLPDHKDKYRTCLGACLSIFTVLALIIFASYRTIVMLNFSEY